VTDVPTPVTLTTKPETELLDVVGIGSPLVDVIARADDELLERLGLTKGSMTLVDLDQAEAMYASMPASIEISGGSAANTVAGVASLGGRAGFIGKVATDAMGDVFTHDITASGVEFEAALSKSRDGGTGRCLVLVTQDAERTMATHLGVANSFAPGDVDGVLLTRTKVTYLEGYLFDLPPAKEAMRGAIRATHESNGSVAISLSDSFCVERHRQDFLELLNGDVDLIFANEDEAMALFRTKSFEGAVEAFAETGVLAAITRGSAGSVVVTPAGPIEVSAIPIEKVVDTNGAGDLYAAGFLYGLTNGLDPEASARLAGLCAAEVISHLGARPQADLRKLAQSHGLLEG
jgi:sugar/nucleoside kinase (ribokinase family)